MAAAPLPVQGAQLPAALVNADREALQKMVVDTLRKLKLRDKKIAELNGQLEKARGSNEDGTHQTPSNDVCHELQVSSVLHGTLAA